LEKKNCAKQSLILQCAIGATAAYRIVPESQHADKTSAGNDHRSTNPHRCDRIGGWLFTLVLSAALGIAAWEYWRLFLKGGYAPSGPVLIGGVILLALSRGFFGFEYSDLTATVLILVVMAVHVFGYRRHPTTAAIDFCITLAGLFYLGWLGSYFFSLRGLPDGQWWFLVVLPAVWFADAGAFLVGRKYGRHRMAPMISPKKTWEGYLGGIVMAAVATPLLALVWRVVAPGVNIEVALLLGFCDCHRCSIRGFR
jgi:phosphatidate cytidylyltransferase